MGSLSPSFTPELRSRYWWKRKCFHKIGNVNHKTKTWPVESLARRNHDGGPSCPEFTSFTQFIK